MSYKLVKNLTTVNYTKGNSGRKYIVIHYTGNKTDSALANANYFKSVNRGSSAHYFVDKTSVYQVVSDDDTAWAVGKNYGSNNLFGKCTNKNSISIEMCSNDGKIHGDTYKNTVELTKKLMKKYNIPASNVVRHYDVCSKICPGWNGWTGLDTSIWKKFKKDISSKSTTSSTNPTPSSTTNKESKPTVAKPTIKNGSKGTQVKYLQQDLNYLGFKGADGNKLTVDSIAGTNVVYALKQFQKKYGLEVDGVYGEKSHKKMKALLGKAVQNG